MCVRFSGRYVKYLHKVLNGAQLKPNKLLLRRVVINGCMNCDGDGGWCPYFKVYKENTDTIYTAKSAASLISSNHEPYMFEMPQPLPVLHGDILFVFKHKKMLTSEDLFRFSFHTGFCEDGVLLSNFCVNSLATRLTLWSKLI
jgi:hypothetical protein